MTGYRGKRAFDLALVFLGAVLWVPLVILLIVLVRIRLGAPALYRQERAGLGGRIFRILKLRTMTNTCDAAGNLLPDEQRLTAFGRALRAASLDELPELLNVIRGDMSLVGPRPLFASYLTLYSARHFRRHDVRPGLTGLAQVRGRNALTWPERFEHDLAYVERCSLALDLEILYLTLRTVVSGRGVSAEGMATMSPFTGYESQPPR